MIQSNNLIDLIDLTYLTHSNKPRCRALTSTKLQCKNTAIHKCELSDNTIYCGIHIKQFKKHNPVVSNPSITPNPYVTTSYIKYRINDYTLNKNVIKIQSLWRMYKEMIYKLVFNNGINSSSDMSILTLDPIRKLNDAFIYYIEIDECKRWYMESLKSMYTWYSVYKKKQSHNTVDDNIKCVYTNKHMSDKEQLYIVNIFNKVRNNNKYLSTSIFEDIKKTLYESIFDNCYNIFTDSTDAVYIDVLLKLSLDSVYRLIIESNKILIDNNIYNVLKTCRRVLDKIKYTKYTYHTLYLLYNQGVFKLKHKPHPLTMSYFIENTKTIEQEYKTLLIKEYFVNELIDKCNTNDILMYYIKTNNIWYYSITNIFLSDLPQNDTTVNNFGQLINIFYTESCIN